MDGTTGQRPVRTALRNRDLRLLLGGTVVDEVGGWAYAVVLVGYVFERTGSAGWVALATTQGMVTAVLLSPYAGVLADRYDRARLLVATSALSALVMTALTVWVATDGPMWLFPVLGITMAAVSRPTRPAAQGLVPDVVPEKHLATANGMFAAMENVVVIVGPGIGAVLLVVSGAPAAAVGLNAVSFVVAALLYRSLRVRSRGDAVKGDPVLPAMTAGVVAMVRHRTAFVLVLFAALDSAVFGALSVLNVPLAVRLDLGSAGYAWLTAAMAVGGVAAAGLANRLASAGRLSVVLVAGIALECVPVALLGVTGSAPVALVLLAVSGAGMVLVDVLAVTALQRSIPRGVLSRVLAAFEAVVIGFIVLASLGAAALLAVTGLTTALVVAPLVVLAVCLAGLPVLLASEKDSARTAARLAPLVDVLAELDLLDGASRTQLEQLAATGDLLEVTPGTELITQGAEADALYVLLAGTLDVHADGEGGRTALPPVTAPGYVGELGLLHGTTRTATVTAAHGVRVLRVPAQAFTDALARTPATRAVVVRADERLARTAALA